MRRSLFSLKQSGPAIVKKFDARRFVLGSLLQKYGEGRTQTNREPVKDAALEAELTQLSLALSRRWGMGVEPISHNEEQLGMSLLGRYALAEKTMGLTDLGHLRYTFNRKRPFRNLDVEDPTQMRVLLERVGFLPIGDNLHRLIYEHSLVLSAKAKAASVDHLDPKDPFDELRHRTPHNIYAIDSATTSEVDDAIGLHVDSNGVEWITVYVSDATVHVPFDSDLEIESGRRSTTTTYLPEGVYFMLPDNIVKAATLREDRPCRTFDIRFRIDEETGQVKDYAVGVGWADKMRRITYDAVQEIYDTKAVEPLSSTPGWADKQDMKNLHRIYKLARIRERMRAGKGFVGNTPDPLVIVRDRKVQTVCDQILSTAKARLAVAELMIAANEVCSRVAQENNVKLPFRGSRPLSSMHDGANSFVPPPGDVRLPAVSNDVKYFAQSLCDSMEQLRGLTKAYYSSTPIYHNGLDTSNYCHSTSPLRRYPDMLVHHQLKTLIAKGKGKMYQEFIADTQMQELCALCSKKQEAAKRLQQKTTRFWILQYILNDVLQHNLQSGKLLKCYVGNTQVTGACPDGDRGLQTWWRPNKDGKGEESGRMPSYVTSSTPRMGGPFRSEIYLPDFQLMHYIKHNKAEIKPGMTIWCKVERIDPYLAVLDMSIVRSEYEKESQAEMAKLIALPPDA